MMKVFGNIERMESSRFGKKSIQRGVYGKSSSKLSMKKVDRFSG